MAVSKSTTGCLQLSFLFDKQCACCKINQPICNFGNSSNRKGGVHVYCKKCKAQKAKELYFRDHELTLIKKAEYVRENKNVIASYKTKWRRTNRDKHNATNKLWAKNNPDMANAKYKKYQMSKRNSVPAWADDVLMKEFYTEAHRLSKSTGVKHHVDHIVPLQSKFVCGLHCEDNLQVIPWLINQRKSNRFWPDMWDPE